MVWRAAARAVPFVRGFLASKRGGVVRGVISLVILVVAGWGAGLVLAPNLPPYVPLSWAAGVGAAGALASALVWRRGPHVLARLTALHFVAIFALASATRVYLGDRSQVVTAELLLPSTPVLVAVKLAQRRLLERRSV